jgi:quinol monooxygenase YgiN
MTKVALLVELKAKLGKEQELATFLTAQQSMAAVEPGMLAWFFVRLDAQTFALFDVFNEDADRQAHLSGSMAAALMPRADELLASPPQIRHADVLADLLRVGNARSVVRPPLGATVYTQVSIKAKSLEIPLNPP